MVSVSVLFGVYAVPHLYVLIFYLKWSKTAFKCVKSIFKMQLLQIIGKNHIFEDIQTLNSVFEIHAFYFINPLPKKEIRDKTKTKQNPHSTFEGRVYQNCFADSIHSHDMNPHTSLDYCIFHSYK